VLLSTQLNRQVFVIQIPQGSTAYQANDGRYYGRSELGAKYLPDHEVRLRMSRGKVARGVVLARVAVDLGVARERRERAAAEPKLAEDELRAAKGEPIELEFGRFSEFGKTPNDVLKSLSAKILPDVVTCDFVFRNDGELTIRAPAVEFRETRDKHLFDEGLVRDCSLLGFGFGTIIPPRLKMEDAIVYPGDEQTMDKSLRLECKRETAFSGGNLTIRWKVFLDNSPPSSGEIDLGSLIESARRQGVADIAE
jgi:hypothetical protein